jgi:hypothetical protein
MIEEIKQLTQEVQSLNKKITDTFIDRETHWKHHQTVDELFGDRDKIDEHKTHHGFLTKWFKRSESAGTKLFYTFLLFVFGVVMVWISGGFADWLKSLAAHAPIVGGYIKKNGG